MLQVGSSLSLPSKSHISSTHCPGPRLGGEEEKSHGMLWFKVTEYQVSPLGN